MTDADAPAQRPQTHIRPAPDLVEDGIPAISETPPSFDIDSMEGEPAPLDRPQAVDEWGTTAAEQAFGEPLELRVLREEPDVLGTTYDEHDLAEEWGNEDTLSSEEAAMQIVDEPPGMSYAPDPGYLADGG